MRLNIILIVKCGDKAESLQEQAAASFCIAISLNTINTSMRFSNKVTANEHELPKLEILYLSARDYRLTF